MLLFNCYISSLKNHGFFLCFESFMNACGLIFNAILREKSQSLSFEDLLEVKIVS